MYFFISWLPMNTSLFVYNACSSVVYRNLIKTPWTFFSFCGRFTYLSFSFFFVSCYLLCGIVMILFILVYLFKSPKLLYNECLFLMISRCASFCLLYFPSQSNFICFYWRTFYILIQVLKWENNPLLIKLNREVTGIESWYPGRYMKAENIKWEAKLWINHIPSFSKYRGEGG